MSRRRLVVASLCAALAAWAMQSDDRIRVATFNIEMFPRLSTDRAAVAQTIAEIDADVLAIQEIVDADALRRVLAEASREHGRDWQLVVGACGGDRLRVTTGIAWDASRVELVEARSFPGLMPGGNGECGRDQTATLAVVETAAEHRLAVLSVHLAPFPERFDERKLQWPRVLAILADAEARWDAEAIALGDYNTTGFSTKPSEEREFVDDVVARAGMELLTGELECTEYWQPVPPFSDVVPSLLDHAVTTGGDWDAPRVMGLCARLRCERTARPAMDPQWRSVSDHCPVVLDGALAD
ncbi:MAG TPA: endonuclease/exonuclease/phosphatase family protein [Nannocystaceae bacterium]|nr:endonuclease/exonuclease/phosphatase family protein [Nannocystaceae bacterium]